MFGGLAMLSDLLRGLACCVLRDRGRGHGVVCGVGGAGGG